jgi:hypothetical protein
MKYAKFLPLLSLVFLAACGPSTKIEKTWTDPTFAAGTVTFHKVLCIAQMPDESSRRIAEDKMVAAFKNVTGVASYKYLQPSDTATGAVDAKLKADGFDGVVIMRLSAVDKSTSYVPGTSYGGYYGRYGYYGGGYGTSGYYQEDKTYYVETNFYSVDESKLLWSATTSSLNPSKLDKSLDHVIDELRIQLKSQKLIK